MDSNPKMEDHCNSDSVNCDSKEPEVKTDTDTGMPKSAEDEAADKQIPQSTEITDSDEDYFDLRNSKQETSCDGAVEDFAVLSSSSSSDEVDLDDVPLSKRRRLLDPQGSDEEDLDNMPLSKRVELEQRRDLDLGKEDSDSDDRKMKSFGFSDCSGSETSISELNLEWHKWEPQPEGTHSTNPEEMSRPAESINVLVPAPATTEPRERPFRDISDVSSMSSFSISSGDGICLEPRARANANRTGGRNTTDGRHALSTSANPENWASPSPSPSSNPPHFDVEFEVASVSIYSDNPIEDSDSSSGIDNFGDEIFMKTSDSSDSLTDETENDADEEWEINDKSDDDVSLKDPNEVSDSELSEKDFWHCTECKARTNSPYLRYCLRCFRIRRNWLPKRPRPSNKKGKKKGSPARRRNRHHTSSEGEPNQHNQQTTATGQMHSTLASTSSDLQTQNSSFPLMSSSSRSASTSLCTPEPNLNNDSVNPGGSNSGPTPESAGAGGHSSGPTPESSSTGGPSSSGSSSIRPLSTLSSAQSNISTDDYDFTDGPHARTAGASTTPSTAMAPPSTSTGPANGLNTQLLKDVLSRKAIKVKSLRNQPGLDYEDRQIPQSRMCSICMVREKDAAFVHGKSAHNYSCYTCADKILKKHGKCPICRKRILRVVKLICC